MRTLARNLPRRPASSSARRCMPCTKAVAMCVRASRPSPSACRKRAAPASSSGCRRRDQKPFVRKPCTIPPSAKAGSNRMPRDPVAPKKPRARGTSVTVEAERGGLRAEVGPCGPIDRPFARQRTDRDPPGEDNCGSNGQPFKEEFAMAKCGACGNDYDKSFQVVARGTTHTFGSFECAIHTLAPTCEHCGVRIIGHGSRLIQWHTLQL